LHWETLCSNDDFTVNNGTDVFYFLWGGVIRKSSESRVAGILRDIKKSSDEMAELFEEVQFGDVKDKAKKICGDSQTKKLVKLLKANTRVPGSKSKALEKFWIDWFSLFEDADIYKEFEKIILSKDGPSAGQKYRHDVSIGDSILPHKWADSGREDRNTFSDLYRAAQIYYCYYRSMFIECDSGSAKFWKAGRSCPFARTKHSRVATLWDHYSGGGKFQDKDTKVVDDEEERKKKEKDLQAKIDSGIKDAQDKEGEVLRSIRARQGISSEASSLAFGTRKRVLKKLRRHGVTFGNGTFTNRFGQSISPNSAFSYYTKS